ncbi:MAG: hypothetical protein V4619_11200 [Bacteroidota bacterium]
MLKKLSLLFICLAFCAACNKKKKEASGCDVIACTDSFNSVGVYFNNKQGLPVEVEAFTATNQRTKESVLPTKITTDTKSYYLITDDSKKSKFTAVGDEVVVSATYPATGQTKTAVFMISGDCKCHVEKVYGPETIVFD